MRHGCGAGLGGGIHRSGLLMGGFEFACVFARGRAARRRRAGSGRRARRAGNASGDDSGSRRFRRAGVQ
ncbi:hypothetical protein DPR00_33910 [Burkholderia pseudomallei]|nr:hypothetical protein CF640_35335 [Burkholderia pseudomallei]PNW95419.1 hypothetical protein CF641_33860 [Burkholderia pseudomallei]PNX14276.1 hypothetical protein CF645_36250 [Burkholderia pseudomallei]PNX28214.1 hypothetical protein CF642_35825 [Burkholderia pseudomallei]RAP78911.1 hypothetical protein DPQ97_36610 [Burkholderia pseudomallei]